jgi:endonuclease/exonuclease/phosphatase family metal-dependent hydrolase
MSHSIPEEATNNMGTSASSHESDSVCNAIYEDSEKEELPTKPKKQKIDPHRPKSDLRFLSFNVRVDSVMDGEDRWANRKSTVAKIIHDQNPDVVGIQGSFQHQVLDLFNLLDEKSPGKYLWFGVGQCYNEHTAEYTGEYNPIFYNSQKLEMVDQGVFWYSLEPAEKGTKSWDAIQPTICTWCRFSVRKDGERKQREEDFYVFNTHWDQGVETRRNSAYLLREYIEQFTVTYDDETNNLNQSTSVILGDFNCTHYANCYKILTKGIDVALFAANDNSEDLGSDEEEEEEEGEDEYDDEESLQLVNCAQGVQIETTYPGFGPVNQKHSETKSYGGPRDVRFGTVVDMILSSPDVVVNNFVVLKDVQLENGRRPSTHYPVMADLSL